MSYYRRTVQPLNHCGIEMQPADASMTGYWPHVPHRCSACGAIEYGRMEEYPKATDGEYDSAHDTMIHIGRVRRYLGVVRDELAERATVHDASKLRSPEKEVYDRVTPLKRKTVYGSLEYKRVMAEMGDIPALHYRLNRHHPEHFANGINGMSLIDILEMLADWRAASEDYVAGDLAKSIEINIERFGIGEQLAGIIRNTARDLGWIDGESR